MGSGVTRPLSFGCALTAACLAWVVGCSGSPAAPSPVGLGQPFDMRAGARMSIDGDAILIFNQVVSDSRCPTDAVCVQAGEAIVDVTLGLRSAVPPPGSPPSLTLVRIPSGSDVPWCTESLSTVNCQVSTAAGKSAVRARQYRLQLVRLLPDPRAGVSISPGDYVATFVVTI